MGDYIGPSPVNPGSKICVTNYPDNGILQAHCHTGFMGDGAKFDDSNQCKGLAPVN